jgi:radical SAM protein with 4Fe4S-binding SPASM domain
MELYKKMMRELNDLSYDGIIAYSGFSEPLFHKDLNELISIARESCSESRLELYTNGDLLNVEKLIKLFNSGLTSIHISLYDGPEQMERFLTICDKIGLKAEQFVLRERFLPKEKGYGLTLSNRAGMIDFKKLGMRRLNEPLKNKCFYPFYMMFIDYTGEVILCSHDWGKKLVVGNLNNESILEVWTGSSMNNIRKRLGNRDREFSPCNECDVKGTYIGREHFTKWQEFYKASSSNNFNNGSD